MRPTSPSRTLRNAGLPEGRWLASGRVRGWGSWTTGVRLQAVQQWDSSAGGRVRTRSGWKLNPDGTYATRGAWLNTGAWTLDWCGGDRGKDDEHGHLAKAIVALREAGFTVERDLTRNEYVVSRREEA